MSRVRFPFRSTPSTPQVPVVVQVQQTPEQKKDALNSSYWDTVYAEDFTNGKGKEVERLWGLENFGNTCYCNSVLQALYACHPFRSFIEAYPSVPPPVSALGPPPGEASYPTDPATAASNTPGSPLASKKENPFDAPGNTPASPTGEKRGWKLGRKPTGTAPTLASIQQQVVKDKPAGPIPINYPPLPLPNPDQPAPNVLETIQTLFRHLSMSPPHQPLPSRKDPKKEAETAQTASLLAPTEAAPPAENGTPTAAKPANPGEPQGPPLLASLPPPSAPRGGGPFAAGSLGRGVVRPEDVLKTIKRENEMFRGMAQQDAHEFLGWVLNKIAEEVEPLDKHLKSQGKPAVLPATKGIGKTFIQNLFEGSLTNETRCLSCETTSSRDELFLDLSIDIEQHTSVTSCLRGFSASEMLCQKNKFYCDSCCGLQEAEKRMKIKRLPNILPLHLKRFKYQESLGRYTKLFYRVPFPTQLRLPNTSDDAEDPDRLYELFAVVVHIGNGPHHGHYVCLVKSNGRWVMCDDENVEPIDEGDIFRYFGDYPSGAGYVMFYQAVDLDLGSLGLKVPPTPVVPALTKVPHPASAPVPAARAPEHAPLIELDEPVSPAPRSPLKLDIPADGESPKSSPVALPAQPSTPGYSTISSATNGYRPSSDSQSRVPSQPPVPTPIQRTPSQTLRSTSQSTPAAQIQRTPSQSTQKDKDTKWYQRKKNGTPTPTTQSPNASRPLSTSPSTNFNALGVNVPTHLVNDGATSPSAAPSAPVPAAPATATAPTRSGQSTPISVPASSAPSRQPSFRAVSGASATSTSGQGGSSGSYSGGSGLGRKLSGMSGKSLMSRSGSLMKLGLGKKDKKEGIEE